MTPRSQIRDSPDERRARPPRLRPALMNSHWTTVAFRYPDRENANPPYPENAKRELRAFVQPVLYHPAPRLAGLSVNESEGILPVSIIEDADAYRDQVVVRARGS